MEKEKDERREVDVVVGVVVVVDEERGAKTDCVWGVIWIWGGVCVWVVC